MKRIISSSIVLAALAFGTAAFAAPFGSTNLVIYREGGDANGADSGALTNSGVIVWLDEYYTNGTFFQSHMMPTNYFGANSALIANGTAFGNGLITRSVDGRFIVVPGYGATLGQNTNPPSSVSSSFATQVPRVIAFVGGNGNIDTTTTLTNFNSGGNSGGEIRSVASTDGTNFWTAGDGLSGGGLQYATRGDSDPITFSGLNSRQINIYSNQIYVGSGNLAGDRIANLLNTNDVNTLPTATNDVAIVALPGTSTPESPWAFVAFKLKAGGADPIDTLYVADGSNFVYKLSKVGASWSNDGSIRAQSAIGLAAQTRIVGSITNVDLWMTGGGGTLTGNDNLYAFTDSTGYHVPASGNANLHIIHTSADHTSFRGIVFAPVGGDGTLSGPGNISVGPIVGLFAVGDTGCSISSASATQTYSVANLGTTGPVSWSVTSDVDYVSFAPPSGSLGSGGSITVTAYLNGNEAGLSGSLDGVTNTATITFSTNNLPVTTRAVRVIEHNQDVSPTGVSGNYVITGQPGGPYTPSNKVYKVFNGATPFLLTVSKSQPWLTLGFSSGTLAGCSSVSVTVSVNQAVAAGLTAGSYADVISFSNATIGALIDSDDAQLSAGGIFFCDDFSTFTQLANLQPQKGWTAFGGSINEPFVSNNAAYVGYILGPANADEPYKNMPQITASNKPNASVFCAMVMTVTSAAPSSTTSPSRIWSFFQNQNATGYSRDQLTVRDTGSNTAFTFGIRINGIGANTYRFGTNSFSYNTPYRVIVQGRADNTNTYVYVEPGPTLDPSTAEASTNVAGSNAADFNIGSVQFGNTFSSAGGSSVQAGIAVFKMCVTTNYTEAYNDTLSYGPPADPFNTWETHYFPADGPNSLPGADPDLDGMSNTNEFLAGFDPTNNAAYLHIISVAKASGTNIVVTYLGANGDSTYTGGPASRTNVLEFTLGTGNGSYTSTNFVSIGAGGTNVLTGGTGLGTLTSFVDTNGASGAAKYYRVRVLVP